MAYIFPSVFFFFFFLFMHVKSLFFVFSFKKKVKITKHKKKKKNENKSFSHFLSFIWKDKASLVQVLIWRIMMITHSKGEYFCKKKEMNEKRQRATWKEKKNLSECKLLICVSNFWMKSLYFRNFLLQLSSLHASTAHRCVGFFLSEFKCLEIKTFVWLV